jgi:HlyD family secretion protein
MYERLRRWAPAILVSSGVIGALTYAFIPEPIAVDVARAKRAALLATIDEEGRAVVRERFVVSAPVGGSVQRIEVEPGDSVKAGDLLAVIQPAAMDERTRRQLVARADAVEDARLQAASAERAARAEFELAAADETRAVRLAGSAAISRSEVELATARRATAEAKLRAAEAAGRAAAHAVQEARAALLGSIETTRHAPIRVRAPLPSTVLRVFQESERVVLPGTPLLELGDRTALEIVADLLSSDAVRVAPGARVIGEGWGGPVPLEGRVRFIEPAGFTKVSALGVDEQRVNIHIDLLEPADCWSRLGDGFAVDVRIVVAERADALTLPAGALFRNGDGWAIFAIESNVARLRSVDVGLRAGYDVEIVRGIREGEEVVLHPPEKVSDGARVRPR